MFDTLALYWFLNRNSSSGSNWTEKRWSHKKVFHSYEDVGSHDGAKEIRWKISKFPVSKAEGSTAISIPLHSSVHRLCNHPEAIQFDEESKADEFETMQCVTYGSLYYSSFCDYFRSASSRVQT